MNNAVFGKTMENVRKLRDLNLKKLKKTCLVSEPNYHTTKFFSKNLLAIELKRNIYEQTSLFGPINIGNQ